MNSTIISVETKQMRRLGLIGGTSWHSTIEYYAEINRAVNKHFGNNTNPPLVLFNVDQAEVHRCQREDNWDAVAQIFIEAALCLEQSQVEGISFCANTPHKVYDQVAERVSVPVIHIADVTARAIQQHGLQRVCFIGTRYSMEDAFVTQRIAAHGIEVSVPEDPAVVTELHRIIQQELTFHDLRAESKEFVIQQLQSMIAAGAQGAVLGCTEFPLMLDDTDLDVPLFNTTQIHATAAVDFILGQEQPTPKA